VSETAIVNVGRRQAWRPLREGEAVARPKQPAAKVYKCRCHGPSARCRDNVVEECLPAAQMVVVANLPDGSCRIRQRTVVRYVRRLRKGMFPVITREGMGPPTREAARLCRCRCSVSRAPVGRRSGAFGEGQRGLENAGSVDSTRQLRVRHPAQERRGAVYVSVRSRAAPRRRRRIR